MGEMQTMECYLAALEEQSGESINDIRFAQNVIYINTFLKRFGKERVYVVGSTGENTKLTNSKDDGDADFLMVSGVYEIDQDQLEFNEHNGCYLRIRADDKSKAIGLETIEDKYIAANSLRELKPELFTILRAIHAHVTATRNCLPEIGIEDTVISVPSKVGLANSRYRRLKLDDKLQARFRQSRLGNACTRNEETTTALEERWKNVPQHESDMKVLHRVFKVLWQAVNLRDNKNDASQISFTTGLLEGVMKRPQLPTVKLFYHGPCDTGSGANGTEEEISTKDTNSAVCQNVDTQDEDIDLAGMQNTYGEKNHMDFVPALRLTGKLDIMNRWKDRAEKANMDSKLINDIYETDIFVVSRVAPNNSNSETDFCLSFNIAEMKLVLNMTSMQRKVFLIMKAFLKSVFEIRHQKNNRDLKLKTYHIKNVLFWLFELNPELSFEEDAVENIMIVTRRATDFLKDKLEKRILPHYFVGSNLFSDFQVEDYRILEECVHEVLDDPVKGLKCYFDLNDGKPSDIVFTVEEIKCLLEMSSDGGRNKHVDRLENAIVDLQRGFNQGPRDEEMRSPIKEAILDIFRLFLEDEQVIDTKIFQQINMLITQGRTHTTPEVNAYIRTIADLLNGIGIFSRDIKQFIDRIGGRPRLEQFLRGAFTGTPVDFSKALDEQILETIDRYLSCQDEEEEEMAGELIYKLVGYFSGRKTFPRLSGLV